MKCGFAILKSAAYPALPYFSTLSSKRNDFRNTLLDINLWFNFFYNFLTLSRAERDMIKNVYWSLRTVTVITVRFLMKLEFSRQVFQKKKLKYKISWKSQRSCSMRTDRQKGRHDERDSPLSLFCERAENCFICNLHHKDNLTFVIIIIITTIIVVVMKVKLALTPLVVM